MFPLPILLQLSSFLLVLIFSSMITVASRISALKTSSISCFFVFDAFIKVPEVLVALDINDSALIVSTVQQLKRSPVFPVPWRWHFVKIALLFFYIRSISKVKYIFILTHGIQEKLQKELK